MWLLTQCAVFDCDIYKYVTRHERHTQDQQISHFIMLQCISLPCGKGPGHCCLRIPSFLFTMYKNRSLFSAVRRPQKKNREKRSFLVTSCYSSLHVFFVMTLVISRRILVVNFSFKIRGISRLYTLFRGAPLRCVDGYITALPTPVKHLLNFF